jgi:type IV secretory pathway protease TraF
LPAELAGLSSGAGQWPDNYANMMLKVAGKRKDIVTINESGVTVNDVLLPASQPLKGQALPATVIDHYELKEDEVLLMSESVDDPFDARYFGPISVDQIDSVISPLF